MDVGAGDHARPERVAQIMKAKRTQARPAQRSVVPAPRRVQEWMGHSDVQTTTAIFMTAAFTGLQVLGRRVGERRAGANEPGSVPRRAWSRTSRNQASAVRFVK
jgi:hypothetical protein